MPKTELLEKNKSASNPLSTKADVTTIAGIVQTLGGGLLFTALGAGALVSKLFSLLAGSSGTFALILFLAGTAGGVLLSWRGIANIKIAYHFRKISRLMGKDSNIQLPVLQRKLGWQRDKLIKSLRRQIDRGFWEDAYIDTDSGNFMLNYAPQYFLADSGNKDVDELSKTANDFIHELTTARLSISDPDLKAKVEHLVEIAKQIFAFIKKNPEKIRQIRRFSNYYLPMTTSLLKDYLELQSEAVKGENIQESIQKIAGSMNTIETAFKNQLNDLYQDKALDISVGIEVLQNMTNENDVMK